MRPFSIFLRAVEHRIVRKQFWQHVLLPRIIRLSDDDFKRLFTFSAGGSSFDESFHASARLRFFFHPRNQKDFFLQLLTQSQSYESILEDADDVLQNKFQTLGSAKVSLGEHINWQQDFKSGIKWPLESSWSLDVLDVRRPSDVKVPWELSRFHQVWWLGKAYWLTHNERYAEKFKELVESWIANNPPGKGVHWVLAMEAAIRSCNWIAGYYLFCESKSLDSDFWLKFWKSLYVHGVFIRNNLEFSRRNGNHFLSNVVGMIFLGMFFQNTTEGQEWLSWGVQALRQEMDRQVSEDGVNWEKSISYHRLVLEFFYTATILCSLYKIKLSHSFLSRLEKMFEYTMHYTRSDGSVPNVGDADDGRLFRFSMSDEVADHRHALSVAAILFERSDFKAAAGKFHQDALWLFGGAGFEKHQLLKPSTRPLTSTGFSIGGMYVMRSERAHVFIDADDIGLRGKSAHSHNDVFSFEFWSDGFPLIVDSGCYSYTFDVGARNEFRSTKSHNTIMVDGKELAELPNIWKVAKEQKAPRILEWSTGVDQDILEAEHYSYEHLGIVHRRKFVFDKRTFGLVVTDTLSGSGVRLVESFLHLSPEVSIELENPQKAVVRKDARRFIIIASTGDWSVLDSWYSRSYGMRAPNKTLRISLSGSLPMSIQYSIQDGISDQA